MAERRPGDVYPRCGTSPGEGGRTSSVIRKTDPWRGLCINHYIRWVGIVIPGGGVSFPLGEGPLRLRRQCVQSLGEALGYGGGAPCGRHTIPCEGSRGSSHGVSRCIAARVPSPFRPVESLARTRRLVGRCSGDGARGWVGGRGGGEGRRRGEACFLLNAKREQEKVEWRGECFAARAPFSFPSGRVLGEDTAVGWGARCGWREGVGGWQGRRRGEAARGGGDASAFS